MSLNSHNFRCCTYGNGSTYVEVPEHVARNLHNPELAFVLDGLRDGRYSRKMGRPSLILVPEEDWDRAAETPIGVSWPQEIEHYVLDYAQDLGWSWDGALATSASKP